MLAPRRTALIVDHSLETLLERIDRVIVLSRSRKLLVTGSPDRVFSAHGEVLVANGIWTPTAVRLRLRLTVQGHVLPKLWRMPAIWRARCKACAWPAQCATGMLCTVSLDRVQSWRLSSHFWPLKSAAQHGPPSRWRPAACNQAAPVANYLNPASPDLTCLQAQ